MHEVVIIGAGISGLSCARHLAPYKDHLNVTVLEASNRIGGRIKTITTNDGTVLDFGAQFIHGTCGNPLYDFALEKNLITEDKTHHFKKYSQVVQCFPTEMESLYPRRDELVKDVQKAESWVEHFVSQMYQLREVDGDLPHSNVGEFMRSLLDKQLTKCADDARYCCVLKSVFMHWSHYENVASGCRSVFRLDLRGFLSYVELEGDSLFEMCTLCERGYEAVVDELSADIPPDCVKLNSRVKGIDKFSPSGGLEKLKVSCDDGATYYADTVVVTVSVGVLKDFILNETFQCDLPNDKLLAIKNLHLANVVKVFFKFETPIASEITYYSFFQPPKTFNTDTAFECRCPMLERIGASDWWLLWAICDDTTFEARDNMTTEEWLNDILASCAATYSNFSRDKCDPDNIIVVDWMRDENYRGAYSYLKTGANEEDIARLALPVTWDERGGVALLFAGEATSEKFFSTTHGAYESGVREAERIVDMCGFRVK